MKYSDTKISISVFSDGRCKPSFCVRIHRLMQEEGGHTVVCSDSVWIQ